VQASATRRQIRFKLPFPTRYLFISPQLILFVGLTILPFILSLPLLFTDMSDLNDPQVHQVGLANFVAIFTDPDLGTQFLDALSRTVVFTTLNYLNIYIFGLCMALVLYEVGFKGWFFTILYLPMMMSGVALGYVAKMLFAQGTGTVNLILANLGFGNSPINLNAPEGTAIILALMVGWRYAGFNVAIFLAGLLAIPKETIEASIVDGTSYWQRLTRIYFPQMVPSFIIASTLLIIGSFGVFDELVALGGLTVNQGARFLSILFYSQAFYSRHLALGMTMAIETFLPLVLIGALLLALQRRAQR